MLNILIQRKWNREHFLWSPLFNSASCCTFSRYNVNYVYNVRLLIFLTFWHVFKEVFTVKCRKQIRYVLCVAFLYYYMKNHALGNLYHVRSLRTLGKFQCLKFCRHRLTSFKREWLLRTSILLGQDGWFLTSLTRPDIVCVNYDLRPLRILSVWHHRNSAIPELW